MPATEPFAGQRACAGARAADEPLPLPSVVHAASPDGDLARWLAGNLEQVERELLRHGAILFRGFAMPTVDAFERAAETLCPDLFRDYGDLPREGESGRVYKSTPYSATQSILFHNEASHTPSWPLKQWFFCLTPAERGGRTPLVDCRLVYRRLAPAVRDLFERRQLLYVRNFTDGLDVSWKDFFKTGDRAEVEARCRRECLDVEWKATGQLRTSRRCAAVLPHPRTGEMLFFNQIQLHHVSCLPPAARRALLSLFAEADLPRQVYFGDGSPIDDAIVDHVVGIYRDAAVGFDWAAGDVLLVDNMLTAHGRDPFVGPRKIVVAMGEMQSAGQPFTRGA